MASSPRLLLENAADKLPSPNGIALAIMQIWGKEDTTVEQLAHLIESDPALCGRLLRLANASVMGNRPVVAVPEAVVRVGLRTVAQIAVSFSLIDNSAQGPCEAFDYPAFWSESLFMAVLCKALAETTRVTASDELFACGLLTRVGELALATIYPQEYGEILAGPAEDVPERVNEEFGFELSALSLELMVEYGIPPALAGPARFHKSSGDTGLDPGSRADNLAQTFRLADRLMRLPHDFDVQEDALPAEIEKLGESLELSREQLLGIYDGANENWIGWTLLLDLPSQRNVAGALAPAQVPAPADNRAAAGTEESKDAAGNLAGYRAALLGDPQRLRISAARLTDEGFTLRECTDIDAARRMALEFLPQLLMIDAVSDVEKALGFCRLARATEWGRAAYIAAVVTADSHAAALYDAGTDAVIYEAVDENAFSARLRSIERYLKLQADHQRDSAKLQKLVNELAVSHHKFEQLSLTDQLTQVPNRRFAMQALARAWNLSVRSDIPMSLLMIDLDRFKSINDQYGHAAGDEVLKEVSRVMNEAARREECVCRLGGEEFLLVSSANPLKPMLIAAERLRRTIEASHVHYGEQEIPVTMSIGVVQRQSSDVDSDSLLSAADKALYLAKNSGRNRIGYRLGAEFSLLRSL